MSINILGKTLIQIPFSGWQWTGDSGRLFRADKPTKKSWYRLYAVLSPNVFRWIRNCETLTQCIQACDAIEQDSQKLSKYFYE